MLARLNNDMLASTKPILSTKKRSEFWMWMTRWEANTNSCDWSNMGLDDEVSWIFGFGYGCLCLLTRFIYKEPHMRLWLAKCYEKEGRDGWTQELQQAVQAGKAVLRRWADQNPGRLLKVGGKAEHTDRMNDATTCPQIFDNCFSDFDAEKKYVPQKIVFTHDIVLYS